MKLLLTSINLRFNNTLMLILTKNTLFPKVKAKIKIILMIMKPIFIKLMLTGKISNNKILAMFPKNPLG